VPALAALRPYFLPEDYAFLMRHNLPLTAFVGGGSALLPSPIPPVTLEELTQVTRMLAHRGATIQQLNTVRKHLELLKGGGLAKTAYPAQVLLHSCRADSTDTSDGFSMH
jgi:glycerate-2-kinase